MKITNEILDAVTRAADHYGNVSLLARKMGIAHSTILFWRSRKTTHISGKLWIEKIRPVLAPFLQDTEVAAHDPLGTYRTGNMRGDVSWEEPQSERTCCQAPLIRVQELESFDPALETISKFIHQHSSEEHSFFHTCRRGSFAFRAGDVPETDFPDDSYLLVSRASPMPGNVVLLRFRENGKIGIRRYFRDGNIIRLEPYLKKSRISVFSWDCQEQRGILLWIFPILEMNMDLAPDLAASHDEEEAE